MSTATLPPRDGGCSGAPGAVARAEALIGDLKDVLWAAHTTGEKMETVAAFAELKSCIDSVELDVVRDLEATKGVQSLGWASTGDFVTAVSGGHKGSGPAAVRLAEALDRPVMAPVAEALSDGWLSVTKAHVIDRAVERLPLAVDARGRGVQVLLAEAKRLDATDLRKAARHLAEVVDPDGAERRDEKAMDREERGAHLDRSRHPSRQHHDERRGPEGSNRVRHHRDRFRFVPPDAVRRARGPRPDRAPPGR